MRRLRRGVGLACGFLAATAASADSNLPPVETRELAREILAEQVAIPSTFDFGTAESAEKLVARFAAAGFASEDVQLLAQTKEKVNLIVRLSGRDEAQPILFLTHLDVVDADPDVWTVEPYLLTEKDGYFYGRGTFDIKCEVAELTANLIRLRREGFVPARDILVAFTADEEAGSANTNGAQFLLDHHRDLIDAAYVVNTDAAGGQMEHGTRLRMPVQTAEKTYATYQVEARGPGGHSSMPAQENAIVRLAKALARLEGFQFPARLSETTRQFFVRLALQVEEPLRSEMRAMEREPPDQKALERLSTYPFYNATVRTTCVATMLAAGHAENALPQRATATLQCRLLPGESPEAVRESLAARLADPTLAVTLINDPVSGGSSPLDPEVMSAVEAVTREMWPEVAVLPVMDVWSTDGARFRRAGYPVFGIMGLFYDIHDNRSHGADERILVDAFYESIEFMYRLMKRLGGSAS